MKTPTVVLYGSNLVISIIGASLRDRAELRVVPMEDGLPQVTQRLCDLNPDVVIFDLTRIQPDWPAEVLKLRPQMVLIGVDLPGDQALVLRGECIKLWTTDDLVHLIETHGARGEKY